MRYVRPARTGTARSWEALLVYEEQIQGWVVGGQGQDLLSIVKSTNRFSGTLKLGHLVLVDGHAEARRVGDQQVPVLVRRRLDGDVVG
jgi:hypothetical protein